MEFLPLVVSWFLWLLVMAFVVRAICWFLGWLVPPLRDNPVARITASITEPMVAPFRGLTPDVNGFDLFSYAIAFFSLNIVMALVYSLSFVNTLPK
jgi:uncharacterized protein YggT (Ycf19 family)